MMTTTVRILGSRAREQVPGTGITLHAPGFTGSLTQLAPGVATAAEFDLPFAEAAAGADVMLAAQLNLQLEARKADSASGLRFRSAVAAHPRVIVPRRSGVAYALLQTDESGVSGFLAPLPGDDTEAVFPLAVAAGGSTRRTLRVLMWPELQSGGPGSLAVAARWERLRRPHQLAQLAKRGATGALWGALDPATLTQGPLLLLLHDTFGTAQATFADWVEHESFAEVAARYQACVAFTHPTLAAGLEDNLQWLRANLEGCSGPVDVVAHGRGGLLARALAVDGRLPLRRVCQVGAPNQGTPLANEAELPAFLDAHVSMLAGLPKPVALPVLEGALCLARCVAQGLRAALPGVEVLTPESAPLRALVDFSSPSLAWFTVSAQFTRREGREPSDSVMPGPSDLVSPAQGCHLPGIPVIDELHLCGDSVHHHNYFADDRVRDSLAKWLS